MFINENIENHQVNKNMEKFRFYYRNIIVMKLQFLIIVLSLIKINLIYIIVEYL
jgi:hypothetical protein